MTVDTPPDRGDAELPRGIALAWGVAANPQRGPKRELSIERIVEAAVEIADAEGLGAVSMSRVAQSLGYTTMSLYRYVTGKDDLLTLMQEFGTGVPPELGSDLDADDWRGRLRFLAAENLRRYLEHPWVLDIPIDGTPATPNNVAWMDAMLEVLADLPVDEFERVALMLLYTGNVRWRGIIERSYTEAARKAGIDPQEIDDARNDILDTLVTAEEFPFVRRAIDAGVFRDEYADPLAFGFERILDGVAAYVGERAAGMPRADPEPFHDDGDPAVLADRKVKEAQRARRDAEKRLRDARKVERLALKDARARLSSRS
ncbi:TetR/AcrR family transcriptional regulator [Agromyces sp. LHK192]|uniref:TetR/AcrR family transcriptional regulator n=1 Tax=Agromyces sp. LHK192 TaxID=2498704 RepID=UPI000FD86D0F|nr:TetR/AcrR family transcriptional regulator [Agromyces sp. LHK192]